MGLKPTMLKGRAWLITDDKGKLIDDIDTDMIFHNAHLAITDIKEMGQHAFGNLKGWERFSKEAASGDLVIAGRNFGSGSSRQQAVECFVSLGIQALICESYGAIYKRNAINSGFPIVEVRNLFKIISEKPPIRHLQVITLDIEKGNIYSADEKQMILKSESLYQVQLDLYHGGGLLNFKPSVKV
jgi:3-isopropylmalate/(R)-2-methylmalate dehydratase small subunit